MNHLKKLEIFATGAAVLLFAVFAVLFFSRWSPADQQTVGAPLSTARPVNEAEIGPLPTASLKGTPTLLLPPPNDSAEVAWTASLFTAATGMAYGDVDGNDRLFITSREKGIQVLSNTGDDLGTIEIIDPDTNQPVFVRDVVWSQLLWLGPPDYGLVVLTDPFENGSFLHVVDPDSGALLSSVEINNNIAIPSSTEFISTTVPTQLASAGNGELYTDRIYTFAPETPGEPAIAFHYLLRFLFDGKILNSLLLSEGPTDEMQVNVVADLAYQSSTEQLYAATYFEGNGRIQTYDLIGTPHETATLDEVPFDWQNAVALSTDQQGQVYIFIGDPKLIYELGQDNLLTALYGFRDLTAEKDYPAVTHLLPGTTGIPMIMTVSPDGTMLFLIDQDQGRINLTAYALNPQ
ncbi:MAG: hypothetical protein WAM60_01865 [Candidatus Promineifilaceae bacterium]